MSSEVLFPVLRSLAVRNYAMYPGSGDGSGFSVDLLPGMSVIVGINGIGKTSLLNLILWVLTGPQTPKKAGMSERKSKILSTLLPAWVNRSTTPKQH
jgi:DNA repair exonuclease SbcCD ATPase subunit